MKTHYTVTHNAHGESSTRWFSALSDAKRHARNVVRLGYAPEFRAHPGGQNQGRPVRPLWFTLWQFFYAVDN